MIYQEVKDGRAVLSGERLWKLAMLFQHSQDSKDYLAAMEIATLSAEAGSESGVWLSAAAEDRYLLSIGEKQKWGTQFTKESGEWSLLPVQTDEESGITDEVRATRHVPARDQQIRAFLKQVSFRK